MTPLHRQRKTMNQESARARGRSYLNPFRSPKSESPGPISRIYFSQNCSALVCSLVQFSVTTLEHLAGGQYFRSIKRKSFLAENKYLEVH